MDSFKEMDKYRYQEILKLVLNKDIFAVIADGIMMIQRSENEPVRDDDAWWWIILR